MGRKARSLVMLNALHFVAFRIHLFVIIFRINLKPFQSLVTYDFVENLKRFLLVLKDILTLETIQAKF